MAQEAGGRVQREAPLLRTRNIPELKVGATMKSMQKRRARLPNDGPDVIAGVRLSHPDRVLYPEQGLTKRDLAEFYHRISDWVLPHIVERPLSLLRCPEGQGKSVLAQETGGRGPPGPPKAVDGGGGKGPPRVPLRRGRARPHQPRPDGGARDPSLGVAGGERRRPRPPHLRSRPGTRSLLAASRGGSASDPRAPRRARPRVIREDHRGQGAPRRR